MPPTSTIQPLPYGIGATVASLVCLVRFPRTFPVWLYPRIASLRFSYQYPLARQTRALPRSLYRFRTVPNRQTVSTVCNCRLRCYFYLHGLLMSASAPPSTQRASRGLTRPASRPSPASPLPLLVAQPIRTNDSTRFCKSSALGALRTRSLRDARFLPDKRLANVTITSNPLNLLRAIAFTLKSRSSASLRTSCAPLRASSVVPAVGIVPFSPHFPRLSGLSCLSWSVRRRHPRRIHQSASRSTGRFRICFSSSFFSLSLADNSVSPSTGNPSVSRKTPGCRRLGVSPHRARQFGLF